nr:MAG TPA: hypothetical protein [Caudoviricetes sp.]
MVFAIPKFAILTLFPSNEVVKTRVKKSPPCDAIMEGIF